MEEARLNPSGRARALDRLGAETFDLVVVGGGVVGCGIAVDAASRGLSVALLEREDFASGASGKSSRLVHGGLRYLAQLELRLVREALAERAVLLEHVAPHLVRPIRFLYPLAHRRFERLYVGAGLLLYDGLGEGGALPRHRTLGREETLTIAPGLDHGVGGAFEYWDAAVDDARLTLSLARTAAGLGAAIVSRIEVTGYVSESGSVVGVHGVDHESGETVRVNARHVVVAAGAATEELQSLATNRPALRMTPSKGTHILIPRERFASEAAIITRTAESVLFLIPWSEHWLIGTTDTPWRGDRNRPVATRAEISYLLAQANRTVEEPLYAADVVAAYAGIRPLVGGAGVSTARISREHVIVRPLAGLTLVAGGKLTTYRLIARDAVNGVGRALGVTLPRSRTDTVQLAGVRRAADIEQLMAEDSALAETLPGTPYTRAEIVYAATHEGALRLEDVLARRTHIAIETPDHGVGIAPVVAELVAPLLGWPPQRVADEVARYSTLAAKETPQVIFASSTAECSISSPL